MSEFRGLYDVRDMVESDKNFVMATFLRGVYYGEETKDTIKEVIYFSLIPKDVFMDNYKKVAEFLIDNRKVTVKVACLKEDPSVILGYSILSNDYQAIVWCFVKKAWRSRGIGKSLVPQYPTAAVHLTALGKTLLPKFPTLIFNPFYPLN